MKAVIAVSTSAAALTGGYLYWLHNRLGQTTHRLTRRGVQPITPNPISTEIKHDIESFDTDEVFHSGRFFSIYERAWRTVARADLPDDTRLARVVEDGEEEGQDLAENRNGLLLTAYLRRNMLAFSRWLPQSYLLYFMASKDPGCSTGRHTFGAEHISKLRFREGDVVCGFYRVLCRRPDRVEFGIEAPAAEQERKRLEGRLIIGICPADAKDGKEEAVEVYSETVMWRAVADGNVVLPIERGVLRFLHELASWWLLEQGVAYLVGLKNDL